MEKQGTEEELPEKVSRRTRKMLMEQRKKSFKAEILNSVIITMNKDGE